MKETQYSDNESHNGEERQGGNNNQPPSSYGAFWGSKFSSLERRECSKRKRSLWDGNNWYQKT